MAKPRPEPVGLADQLRAHIRRSNLNPRALGVSAGVAQPIISRFLTGERDIRLETAGRLVAVLGVDLVVDRRRRSRSSSG